MSAPDYRCGLPDVALMVARGLAVSATLLGVAAAVGGIAALIAMRPRP